MGSKMSKCYINYNLVQVNISTQMIKQSFVVFALTCVPDNLFSEKDKDLFDVK